MPNVVAASGEAVIPTSGTVTHLADIITPDMMTGVFSEVFGVLPVVIPAIISFIAVRKGLSFLLGALRKA